jgi:hypothetical protein
MAEPASSTASIAIAAGTITLSGSVFGVQYDALLAGFFGGLVSLSYLPHMPAFKVAGSMAGSALLAGFAAGAALGIAAQVLIPSGLKRLRSLVGGQ